MWLVLLLAWASASARSFVGVTSWPSFRFGSDLGRFEWFADVQWDSWLGTGTYGGRWVNNNELWFGPSLGCNVQLYDSTFKAYVGGTLGADFIFVNGEYTDVYQFNVHLGGGLEFVLSPKLSLLAEYMFGIGLAIFPESPSYVYDQQWRFYPRPSVQLRYYIGPW